MTAEQPSKLSKADQALLRQAHIGLLEDVDAGILDQEEANQIMEEPSFIQVPFNPSEPEGAQITLHKTEPVVVYEAPKKKKKEKQVKRKSRHKRPPKQTPSQRPGGKR